jgi:hypothetical protein
LDNDDNGSETEGTKVTKLDASTPARAPNPWRVFLQFSVANLIGTSGKHSFSHNFVAGLESSRILMLESIS